VIVQVRGGNHRTWSFGGFTLDADRGSLSRDGVDVKLRPQSFAVLSYLVQHHGVLVTKEELLDAIWGRKAVTDDSLTHCLIDIRKALGDDARQKIRTIPRRGFIFEIDIDEPASEGTVAAASVGRWRLVATVAIIVGILGIGYGALERSLESPRAPDQSIEVLPKSIAVLPFADMSESQDQAYFAAGMSEEIINLLAQIDDLQVIARTSSFLVGNGDIDVPEIARRLKVTYVLEGSVRKSGDRIRVTAQLVNGASMMHLWSRTYDRDSANAIDVQTDIATAVAGVLEETLMGSARAMEQSPAYDLYLQARFIYNRRGPNDVRTAESYYQQAIALDPDFAPAWAGLAGVYGILIFDGKIEFETGLEMLREAAETAARLDPNLAEAKLRLSQAHYMAGESELGEKIYLQALHDYPNNTLTLGFAAGRSGDIGDLETAIDLQRRATVVDPLNAVNHQNLASFLSAAGYYKEAIKSNRRMLNLSPKSLAEIGEQLAHLYILQGRYEDALKIIRQCPESLAKDQGLALVYHAMGRSEEARLATRRFDAWKYC
jgi:TolB-like protein/DNA-binding winged helix-turn-helix (wHTH) protein